MTQAGQMGSFSFQVLPDNVAELRLKEYIQPFEKALARAELMGLLPLRTESDPFEPIASPTMRVAADRVPTLIARLAYWEEIIYDSRYNTHQVVLERTASGKSTRQYRNLRYGSHDIHEYRGKFFPQLVRALLNYARLPEGSLVLDPMSGSGTTNCEARLLGMRTIGMDLNPLSVLIAKTKCDLLTADPAELRANATRVMNLLRTERPTNVTRNVPWTSADHSYLSRWFHEDALVDVALILSAVGLVERTASAFLRLCLSNVLRTVSWQKNDDLRVRKEIVLYRQGQALDLFQERVEAQLRKLIPFLNAVRAGYGAATMYVADMREGDSRIVGDTLSQYKGLCDVLITSPPYATALPYLDTDRLSLIALGLLPRADHRTRDTLMIGNREVSEAQRRELWASYVERKAELPPSVQELVERLATSYHQDRVGFRRRNLPALLAKYFLDVTAVMQSSLSLMRKGAPAFVVVGSNSTRVDGQLLTIDTERLLQDVATRVGWRFDRRLDMELLPSRDIFRENRGAAETLLSFTAGPARSALFHVTVSSSSRREPKRDGSWDFHGEDTQQHLHGLHPYPARFIPQIPQRAIREYGKNEDLVLDPFCGGGTTLLEASLLGHASVGVDNNAVAHLIACAKTTRYGHADLAELDKFVHDFFTTVGRCPKSAWSPSYNNLEKWFTGEALRDLSAVRWTLEKLSAKPRLLAMGTFSSIIVRASNQDSDTRYAAVQRDYKPGSAQRWFIGRMRQALKDAYDVEPKKIKGATIHLANSRDLRFLETGSVGLIVTSPPYLNAYDYHKYHRHRLHWLDADVAFARDLEIGKHDEFTKRGATPDRYFFDMELCLKEWYRVCRPGAHVVLVVGDAIVSGEPVPVADMLIGIAKSLGFGLTERYVRSLQIGRKSFNPKQRIDMEHVVVLEREEYS